MRVLRTGGMVLTASQYQSKVASGQPMVYWWSATLMC